MYWHMGDMTRRLRRARDRMVRGEKRWDLGTGLLSMPAWTGQAPNLFQIDVGVRQEGRAVHHQIVDFAIEIVRCATRDKDAVACPGRRSRCISQAEFGTTGQDVINPIALVADQTPMPALEADPGHADAGAVAIAANDAPKRNRIAGLALQRQVAGPDNRRAGSCAARD